MVANCRGYEARVKQSEIQVSAGKITGWNFFEEVNKSPKMFFESLLHPHSCEKKIPCDLVQYFFVTYTREVKRQVKCSLAVCSVSSSS